MGIVLGVRGDLAMAVRLPMFWVKVAYVACLAAASLLAALRLSQPGLRLSWGASALVAPVLAMWLLAASGLMRADPTQRTQLFFGETWASCPLLGAALSAPGFVAVLWGVE